MYKRILLKLSGEQLQGERESGFDPAHAAWLAKEIKHVTDGGTEVVIMVGGGNFIRGDQIAGNGIERITAHNAGMLGTVVNGLLLSDVFNASGLPARVLSNIKADQVVDQCTYRRAMTHLAKGRVVIVAGGSGRPFFTTDTGAVNVALEMGCDVILKTTKVDGVYDRDPMKFDDAKKFDELTFQQAIENAEIKVMDKAALGLAMEQRQPILIFDLLTEGNIARAAKGETIGTLVK